MSTGLVTTPPQAACMTIKRTVCTYGRGGWCRPGACGLPYDASTSLDHDKFQIFRITNLMVWLEIGANFQQNFKSASRQIKVN